MKDCEILFVDDDVAILDMVERFLTREGYAVQLADGGRKALELLKERHFDIVFTDVKMPEINGLELLAAIKEYRPETEVIVVTGHGTMESAIQAMKIGSYDYLQKPFKLDLLKLIIDRILEEKRFKDANAQLKARIKERHGYGPLVGISLPMQEIFAIIDHMKTGSPNVLIEGETGTGKALTAQVIHRNSDRQATPLVPVTCRTFFNGLAETGRTESIGRLLDTAADGALYLDEITDIVPDLQVEFLKVLKARQKNFDGRNVRLIGATSSDLKASVERDRLRRDFLNHVNAVSIKMPPLRERKEDICLLINHFLNKHNAKSSRKVYNVSPEASDYLLGYHWPGNVIQLENVFERAFALGVETLIEVNHLPAEIRTFGEISKLG
jgi:DNA-binding NtrC family response regulator